MDLKFNKLKNHKNKPIYSGKPIEFLMRSFVEKLSMNIYRKKNIRNNIDKHNIIILYYYYIIITII